MKTYKREFAVLAVWVPYLALVIATFFAPSPDRIALVQSLWVPAAGLVGGAFGMDAYSKQVNPPRDLDL